MLEGIALAYEVKAKKVAKLLDKPKAQIAAAYYARAARDVRALKVTDETIS